MDILIKSSGNKIYARATKAAGIKQKPSEEERSSELKGPVGKPSASAKKNTFPESDRSP